MPALLHSRGLLAGCGERRVADRCRVRRRCSSSTAASSRSSRGPAPAGSPVAEPSPAVGRRPRAPSPTGAARSRSAARPPATVVLARGRRAGAPRDRPDDRPHRRPVASARAPAASRARRRRAPRRRLDAGRRRAPAGRPDPLAGRRARRAGAAASTRPTGRQPSRRRRRRSHRGALAVDRRGRAGAAVAGHRRVRPRRVDAGGASASPACSRRASAPLGRRAAASRGSAAPRACSSASCWTERWWPPGTATRRLPGAAACSARECSTGTRSSPSACRSSSRLAERAAAARLVVLGEQRARAPSASARNVEAPGRAARARRPLGASPGRSPRPRARADARRPRRAPGSRPCSSRAARPRRRRRGEQRRHRRDVVERAAVERARRSRRGRAWSKRDRREPVGAAGAREVEVDLLARARAVEDHDAAERRARRAGTARRRGPSRVAESRPAARDVDGAHGVA